MERVLGVLVEATRNESKGRNYIPASAEWDLKVMCFTQGSMGG